MPLTKQKAHQKRAQRVRTTLRKRALQNAYRLSVQRSGKHIYAQIIDDGAGKTLVAASTLDKDYKKPSGKDAKPVDSAKAVGGLLATKAKKAKIEAVYFDRGGYLYHGRVKALADGAREGGLQF